MISFIKQHFPAAALCILSLSYASPVEAEGIYYRGDTLVIPAAVSSLNKFDIDSLSVGYTARVVWIEDSTDEIEMDIWWYTKDVTEYHYFGLFYNFKNLESVYVGRNIKCVGDPLKPPFLDNKYITSATFGPDVTDIPDNMFEDAEKLTALDLSKAVSLQTVGDSAFDDTGLESVTLPPSVTEVCRYAFNDVGTLTLEGNDASKSTTLTVDASSAFAAVTTLHLDRNVKMADGVTEKGAFENLTALTIGGHVTSIGDYLFYNSDKLGMTVVFPASLDSIGKYCFANCDAKGFAADFGACTKVQKINVGAFSSSTNMQSVVLPPNLVTIEADAFWRNSFTEVTIPSSVVYIGDDAFDCQSPNDIAKVTLLGDDASKSTSIMNVDDDNFMSATTVIMDHSIQGINSEKVFPAVKTLTVGTHCTEIGAFLCENNDDLKTVTLPSTLVKIKEKAFYNCDGIENIYCRATTPPTLESNAWENISDKDKKPLHVPTISVNAYKAVSGWDGFDVRPLDTQTATKEVKTDRTMSDGGAYRVTIEIK